MPTLADGEIMNVIVSDGDEATRWEHVSVSLPTRCPHWVEMSRIKNLFWDPGECVVQYHPPERDYVNDHEFCLHLWKPIDEAIPTPPTGAV